jgi:hypothetical protein
MGVVLVPFVVGGLEGWRTTDGARFADIEGEGDERDEATPLVCIPGGGGRLILDATDADGVAVTGAMFGRCCRP